MTCRLISPRRASRRRRPTALSDTHDRKAHALRDETPTWRAGMERIDYRHTVLIEDARGRGPEFTLDRNGFTLINAPTAVRNFYDPDEIKSVYYPEVERLLRDTLGASRVVALDDNVRNGGRSDIPQPSRRVHNDDTVDSAPRRARDHMGAEAEELLNYRFGIVNVGGRSVARCWTYRRAL